MAESLPGDPRRWLIDAGNDTNWGQVLVGNVADRDFWDEQAFVDQTSYLLPAPTVQRSDLLTAVSTAPPDVDCAAALDLTDQDPTINQMMASLALQVVRRMAAGACPFMASTWTWSRARSPPPTPPQRRWRGWCGPTPSQRPSGKPSRTHSEKKQGEEKPCLTKRETPRAP